MPSPPSSPPEERDPEAARLAHDVANALASVVARLSVLEHRDLSPEVLTEIRTVLEDVGRARSRLRDLLEHSRGDFRGPLCLTEAWREQAAPLAAAGIRVSIEDATSGARAFANRRQVAHILSSIVGTERASLPAGGTLEARVEVRGERIGLRIRSSAPPFSTGELERLLDPFLLKKPEGCGDGMGFAACERIATRNGGSLVLAATETGAREYRLELLAGPPRVSSTPPESLAAPLLSPGRADRCLVVDDDPRVRDSCGMLLRHLGIEVDTAASGEEALERLGRETFGALILDLNLGKPVDGEDVLAELRRSAPAQLARTIIATGDPTRESIVDLSRELGLAILPKPFGVDELRKALELLPR